MIIYKDEQVVADLNLRDFTVQDFSSRENLIEAINKLWFRENKSSIFLFLLFSSTLIFCANFLFLILASTIIIYLISRKKVFSFENYAEVYSFVLYCLGFPTILSTLGGIFWQFSIADSIYAQNILFVLVLVWVYFKTGFKSDCKTDLTTNIRTDISEEI